MLTIRRLLTSLLFTTILVSAYPQNGRIDKNKLDNRIKQLIDKYHIPSAEVTMLINDSLIYNFSNNVSKGRRNYYIGSCSKSFTALTVLRLTEKGTIDINRPVKDYLPWFTLKDPVASSKIKVVHLLNQTSGIESKYGFFDYQTGDTSLFRLKLLNYLRKIELKTTPGEAFMYSNMNYLLLGSVAEAATGKKYSELVKENVFSPLGMTNTYAGAGPDITAKNVRPYQYAFAYIPAKSHDYPHSDLSAAFGCISSNTSDLLRYLKFMISKGITENSDTLISDDTYNKLVTPVKNNYAMGWTALTYNNVKMILHTGLNENYSAIIAFYPDYKTGIAVLCNINSLEFCSLVQSATADMLAGKPFNEPMSLDLILRYGTLVLVLLTLTMLVTNFLRWKKYGFHTGPASGVKPWMRLIPGIFFSLMPVILLIKTYQISLGSIIDFQPDIAWGIILTAIFGIASSLMRFFGTYSKNKPVIN